MLKYLQDSKEQTGNEIKKVAIFTDKAAIGQELIRCVNLFAPDYGLDVVAEVDYSSNATDLSSQVLALKQADPDAILCDSYIGDATLFVQTLKEQNYKPKMIVAKANGFTDPSFIPNLGASANGVASVVEFNPDLTNGVEINEDFKKVYNVNMNGHSAESYTVVWLFKTAIEKAGSTDGAAVRTTLIEHNLRLVVFIARKFDNTGIMLEDLISIGTIGLIKAVNTFDPSKKIKLATYASRCIENEVLMFLRRHSRTRMEVSLDEPLKTDWDGNELLLSDVLGTDPDMVSRGIEENAERQMLFAALSHLSPREQQIMDLRFGLHGHPEMTQKEVADILGISQSYISRLEKRILHRLHGELVREEGYA